MQSTLCISIPVWTSSGSVFQPLFLQCFRGFLRVYRWLFYPVAVIQQLPVSAAIMVALTHGFRTRQALCAWLIQSALIASINSPAMAWPSP